jgi:hypothetical protein
MTNSKKLVVSLCAWVYRAAALAHGYADGIAWLNWPVPSLSPRPRAAAASPTRGPRNCGRGTADGHAHSRRLPRFLLEAGDVTLGTLELATICEARSHTCLELHSTDPAAVSRLTPVPARSRRSQGPASMRPPMSSLCITADFGIRSRRSAHESIHDSARKLFIEKCCLLRASQFADSPPSSRALTRRVAGH